MNTRLKIKLDKDENSSKKLDNKPGKILKMPQSVQRQKTKTGN